MRATGPATRPMTTAPSPLSTRARIAVRATPSRRLPTAARADPSANSPHPALATGPMTAAAASSLPSSSASRIGWNVSKTTIPADQNSSTATRPPSTRLCLSERQTLPDHDRRLAHRGRGPTHTDAVAGSAAVRLLEDDEHGDEVHDAQPEVEQAGQQQGALGGDGVPPDEPTRDQRAERHRRTENRSLPRQVAVDVGPGLGRVDRVDEPRLERSGVERPEHPGQHRGQRELPPGGGRVEDDRGRDEEDRRRDVDRPTAERVGEPAGRQLEKEDGDAGQRGRGERLGDGEAALQRPEREDPDDQARPGTSASRSA